MSSDSLAMFRKSMGPDLAKVLTNPRPEKHHPQHTNTHS